MKEYKNKKESLDLQITSQKQCTYVDKGIRCKNKAKHFIPGSEIALCDKHNKELNDAIDELFE